MERREVLKQVGVAAGAGAAGVGGIVAYDTLDGSEDGAPLDPDVDRGRPSEVPRSAVPDRYAEQFGTIVDVVEAGATATVENTTIATASGIPIIESLEAGDEVLTP